MKVLLAALLAVLLTGCATMHRGDMKRSHDVDVYPATQTNLDLIANPRKYDIYYIFLPVAILDLPFSLVFDTLFLPADLLVASDAPQPKGSQQDSAAHPLDAESRE